MWVYSLYRAESYPEVVIFRDDLKRLRRISQGEKVITDNWYVHEAVKQPDALGKEDYQNAVRGRHEGVNGRLKRVKVLTAPFRHDKDRYGLCFFAVADFV